MNQNVKSATTAGLLGIFLGAFGAHNWYLGEKSKGIIHVCMAAVGILLEIIAAVATPKDAYSLAMAAFSGGFMWTSALAIVGGLIISASGVWGFIEGIMILTQGDAGLARKGHAVAAPAPMQGYGYPNQPYYGQPVQGQPMQGQPMPGQPMPEQPMPTQPAPTQPMQGQPMEQPVQNQPVATVEPAPAEAAQPSTTDEKGNNNGQ